MAEITQNSESQKFAEDVKLLIVKKVVANQKTLAKEIEYDETSLTQVLKGRRNIPDQYLRAFYDKYHVELERLSSANLFAGNLQEAQQEIARLQWELQQVKEEREKYRLAIIALIRGDTEAR